MGSNIVHVQGQGKTKVWLIRHSMFDLRVKVACHHLERLVIGLQGTYWVQSCFHEWASGRMGTGPGYPR